MDDKRRCELLRLRALIDQLSALAKKSNGQTAKALRDAGELLGVLDSGCHNALDALDIARAEADEAKRTLWCVVHGLGVNGKVMLFRSDLEKFPGHDRAWMETVTEESTGCVTLRAFERALDLQKPNLAQERMKP